MLHFTSGRQDPARRVPWTERRPLDGRRTNARSTTTTTKTNAGNPTRPSLPRFALHARPSTRRRRRDPGLLNDDDEASERSLENGTRVPKRLVVRERRARSRSRVPNRGSEEQEQEQNGPIALTVASDCADASRERTDERLVCEIKLNFKGGAESSFSRAFFLISLTLFIHTLLGTVTHVFNDIKTVCTRTRHGKGMFLMSLTLFVHTRRATTDRRSEQSVKTWMRRDTRFMWLHTVYTYMVWYGMARVDG